MIYLFTFLAGGTVVTLAAYLSRNGHPDFAGIIMTMPVITMISLAFTPVRSTLAVGTWGMAGLGAAALFIGLYLGVFNLLGQQYRLIGLFLSVVMWVVAVKSFFVVGK